VTLARAGFGAIGLSFRDATCQLLASESVRRGADAFDTHILQMKSERKPTGRQLRLAVTPPSGHKLEHVAHLPMDIPPPKPEEPYEKVQRTKVLLWHSLGYLVVLIVAWSEPLGRLFFDRQGGGDPDLFIKTILLLLMWPISTVVIYRLVNRLTQVEKFLRICGWCSRVEVEGQWMKIEEHYRHEASASVPHGLCPLCAAVLFPTVGEDNK